MEKPITTKFIYVLIIIFAITSVLYCSGCIYDTTYEIGDIELFQNSKGEYWLIWELDTNDPTTSTIWMSKSHDGSKWSNPELFAPHFSSNPSIIEDISGVYRIVWVYEGGNNDGIWMAYSKDGVKWNKTKIINISEYDGSEYGRKYTIEKLKIVEQESGALRIFLGASDVGNHTIEYAIGYIESQDGVSWSRPRIIDPSDIPHYKQLENSGCMVPETSLYSTHDVIKNQEGKCMVVYVIGSEIFLDYSEDGINWGNTKDILTVSKEYEKEPLITI